MEWTKTPNPHEPPGRHLHPVGSADSSPLPVAPPWPEDDPIAGLPGDEFARAQLDLFRHLIEVVGSVDALWHLDAEPLPDEPFDWSGVEERDAPFVREVLALTERYCDAALDTEYRTIARRILARVAARDPRPLRRSAHAERVAAGLVWLAGRASGEFGRRGMRTSSMLWAWFGVNSCADRGRTLRAAAGLLPDESMIEPWAWSRGVVTVGDAALLHSRHRSDLAAQRDYMLAVAGRRRTWSFESDGRSARIAVQADVTKPLSAVKGLTVDEGRATVIVGFGERHEDARYLAFSVPDAHELVGLVQRALDAALPTTGVS